MGEFHNIVCKLRLCKRVACHAPIEFTTCCRANVHKQIAGYTLVHVIIWLPRWKLHTCGIGRAGLEGTRDADKKYFAIIPGRTSAPLKSSRPFRACEITATYPDVWNYTLRGHKTYNVITLCVVFAPKSFIFLLFTPRRSVLWIQLKHAGLATANTARTAVVFQGGRFCIKC